MLKKWRDAGLLPRPEQRSLGRGKGSATVYPGGTSEQLLRVLSIRKGQKGRFKPDHAFLRLWWEGYPVEGAHVNKYMESALERLKQWSENWKSATPDERITFTTSPDHLPEPMRTIRRRVGRQGFDRVTSVLLRFAASDFTSWEDDEERSDFLQGMGLDRAMRDRIGHTLPWLRGPIGNQLHGLAVAMSPASLHDALSHAIESDELNQARDELQAFIGFIIATREILEMATGKENAFGLWAFPDPRTVNPSLIPSLVLGWLAIRRIPVIREGYETLMKLATTGAPRQFFIEFARNGVRV